MLESACASTLELVSTAPRRQAAASVPYALVPLFEQLSATRSASEADAIESRIWELWMYHPHHRAARHLDRAASEIAAHCHDIAETRLERLTRHAPDYAEAWNKRATLYYLQERDDECLQALHQVLALEPRHFGAMCAFAEILLSRGERDASVFAFETALRIHPHLAEARQRLLDLH